MRVHPVPGRERFGVDGVEGRHRDRAVVERGEQRVLVDERAARDVHEVHALLHPCERRGVEQPLRAMRRRRREHHVVGAGQQLVEAADELDLGDRARRVGAPHRAHVHPERERTPRDRPRRSRPGRPARRSSPAQRSSVGIGKFQYFGGSCRNVSGNRFAHARIAAITHSEIGTALAPRAHVTVRPAANTVGGTPSIPVPVSCTQLHAGRVDPPHDVVPAEVAAVERVGVQARGRIAARVLDELDIGRRRLHEGGLGRAGTQLAR